MEFCNYILHKDIHNILLPRHSIEVLHAMKVFVSKHILRVKDCLTIACFSMYVFTFIISQFVISFCICCRLLLWQWMSGLLLFAFLTRYLSFTFKAVTLMSGIVISVSSCPFIELGHSRTGVPKAGTDIVTCSCCCSPSFLEKVSLRKDSGFVLKRQEGVI